MLKLHRFMTIAAALIVGNLTLLGSSAALAGNLDGISRTAQGVVIPTQHMASMPLSYLRALLTPSGWAVDRDMAGNLLLFPGGAAATPRRVDIASLQVNHRGKSISRKFSKRGFTPVEVQRWRSLMQPHGWRVQSNVAGNLLLFPGSVTVAPRRVDIASLQVIQQRKSLARQFSNHGFTPVEVQRWRSLMQPHGWRVESNLAGNLLLFPRAG